MGNLLIPGLNRRKCQQRNLLAGLRQDIETLPVRLGASNQFTSEGSTPLVVVGYLPQSDEEKLAEINERLPEGKPKLALDQVFLHDMVATTGDFLPDRYAFNGVSTLLNVAGGASEGVAFMNSHRTGGYSEPTELPYGKTFAGQYQERMDPSGNWRKQSVAQFYMLRGIQPNGANGPTTDTLDAMINGGTLFDVSIGLTRGPLSWIKCNVCGNDYVDYRECGHIAGTSYNMSEEDHERAIQLGVPDGLASVTYEDWVLSEVSGVYDGAAPGAGFRKGAELMQTLYNDLHVQSLDALIREHHWVQQFVDNYASILGQGEENMKWADKILGRQQAPAPRTGERNAPAGPAPSPRPMNPPNGGSGVIDTADTISDAQQAILDLAAEHGVQTADQLRQVFDLAEYGEDGRRAKESALDRLIQARARANGAEADTDEEIQDLKESYSGWPLSRIEKEIEREDKRYRENVQPQSPRPTAPITRLTKPSDAAADLEESVASQDGVPATMEGRQEELGKEVSSLVQSAGIARKKTPQNGARN